MKITKEIDIKFWSRVYKTTYIIEENKYNLYIAFDSKIINIPIDIDSIIKFLECADNIYTGKFILNVNNVEITLSFDQGRLTFISDGGHSIYFSIEGNPVSIKSVIQALKQFKQNE